jgi:tetratricopeptide (TPR) repeat protein
MADGQSLFLACEFKRAARVFEKALSDQPENAPLHFWLGKSYARLAEISSPLSAPANARKARGHLEQAVRLDPQNREYRQELFDFYVDSPEWFHGGLRRAVELLERAGGIEIGGGDLRRQIVASQEEHSGASW